MFRSTTIIRELSLNLTKVIFMLKHSVKLRRYMLFDDVVACHRAACVLCAAQVSSIQSAIAILSSVACPNVQGGSNMTGTVLCVNKPQFLYKGEFYLF